MKDGTALNAARADVNSLPSPPSNAPRFAPLLQPPLIICVPRSPELAPGGTELAGSPLVRGSRVLHLSLAGSERKARLGVSSYYLLQVRVRPYYSPLTVPLTTYYLQLTTTCYLLLLIIRGSRRIRRALEFPTRSRGTSFCRACKTGSISTARRQRWPAHTNDYGRAWHRVSPIFSQSNHHLQPQPHTPQPHAPAPAPSPAPAPATRHMSSAARRTASP